MLERDMWKLKNKGFTLIEILCSLALFAIIFLSALSIMLSSLQLKAYNKNLYNYTIYMESLRSNIISNIPYKDIEKLNNDRKYYIYKENIHLDRINSTSFLDLFNKERPSSLPYIIMKIDDGDIIKINLELHLNKNEVISCEFVKGKYL